MSNVMRRISIGGRRPNRQPRWTGRCGTGRPPSASTTRRSLPNGGTPGCQIGRPTEVRQHQKRRANWPAVTLNCHLHHARMPCTPRIVVIFSQTPSPRARPSSLGAGARQPLRRTSARSSGSRSARSARRMRSRHRRDEDPNPLPSRPGRSPRPLDRRRHRSRPTCGR